jgi:hypothetical protein
MQYLSLLVLALGVAVVQLSSIEKEASDKNVEHADGQLIGLLAVFVLVLPRGLRVYFERCSSPRRVSVYMRNMQLAMWSILLGLVPVFLNDFDSIRQNGFFQGYDKIVVVIVWPGHDWTCCSTRNEVRGYHPQGICNISSGRLATVLSIFIWNAQVDGWFVIRNSHGHDSSALYSNTHPERQRKHHTQKSSGCRQEQWLSLLG